MSESHCPTRHDLKGLIDGGLPSEAVSTLTDHVGVCVGCRQELEGIACDDPHFSEVVRHIDQDQPPQDSAYWRALDAAQTDGMPTGLFAEQSTNGIKAAAADELSDSLLSASTSHPSGELKLDFLGPPEVPGQLGVLGTFRILRVLGRGGMGVVLHGFDPCLQRDIAIKVLDPQLAGDDLARARFCREARAAAAVTHENLVAVHQVDEDEASGMPYLIMQMVNGESLDQRLKRVGKLTVPEIARLGMQAAAGLAAAHAGGLIHRDIKPGNILIEEGTDRVKLTDFGLARAAEDMKLTRTGFVAGTPLYMAPEQARGEDVDSRADLFSLGTVLYEAAAGKPPFEGKTPLAVLRRVADDAHPPLKELIPDSPQWLSDVIDHLLEKNPADRIQTAAEVAERFAEELALIHSLHPLDVPAEVCGMSRGSQSRLRRRRPTIHWGCALRRAIPWAGGVVLGAVAVGLFTMWGSPALPPANDGSTNQAPLASSTVEPSLPPIAILDNGKSGAIWGLAFAPVEGDNILVSAAENGEVKVWNVNEQALDRSLPPLEGMVGAVEFSADGNELLTASDDSLAIIWETMNYASKIKVLMHPNSVKSAAFSPNGDKVATGDRASTLRVFKRFEDLSETNPIQVHGNQSGIGHRGAIHAVAFSPDGKKLVSAGVDRTARVWKVNDSLLQERVLEHEHPVYGAAFSPDGAKIATAEAAGQGEGRVHLWNAELGSQSILRGPPRADAWAVSFSHDGKFLAASFSDGTVRVWEVPTGHERVILHGENVPFHTVRFARDGLRLAAGGRNGKVRVWDLADLLAGK